MKNLILFLCFSLFASYTFSQNSFPIDSNTNLVSFEEIVEIPGVNADMLYKRTEVWAKDYFKNPSSVLKMKDAEKKKIEGKHSFNIYRDEEGLKTITGLIKYTFTLWFKDGKARYKITKINLERSSYYGIEKWLHEENQGNASVQRNLEQVGQYFKEFQDSLVKGFNTPIKEEINEDDW